MEVLSNNCNLKNVAIVFAKKSLEENKPARDYYRELLQLTLIFLGDSPPIGISVMFPGAIHQAWSMATILYSIKVWMYRKKFKLTAKEQNALKDISPVRVPAVH